MSTATKTHDSTHTSRQSAARQNGQESIVIFPVAEKSQDKNGAFAGAGNTFFQPKLHISQPNDPLEQEADRVAEEVVESIDSQGKETDAAPPPPPVGGEGNSSPQAAAFFQRKPAFESPTELDLNTAAEPEVQLKAAPEISTTWTPPPVVNRQEEDLEQDGTEHTTESTTSIQTFAIQREKSSGGGLTPSVTSDTFNSRLATSKGGGKPLPQKTQQEMNTAFSADFSQVRIHTGNTAAQMSSSVYAKAFAHKGDIYFNEGQYQPETKEGKKLIAHELTHVVQQGHASQNSVQRSPQPVITQTAQPSVQRGIVQRARDYFADKANLIPGYAMLTVIIGFNPINGRDVPRNAANIFRAIMGFLPGGDLIWQALNNHGIFAQVGAWIEQQLDTLGDIGSALVDAVWEFIDSLGVRDVFRLGSVWRRAKRIFTRPIDMIISFVRGLVTDILKFIKDAILRPLAALAEGTDGYDLLKAILGEDPITGEAVPRTADTLIGGFMKLIGQEEIWENIKRANAIPRAWAWFQGVLSQLLAFVSRIPTVFINALQALEIMDIVLVPRAFAKVIGVFGSFLADFISWAGNAMWDLLKIIFEVVAPGAMPYLNRAAGAFRTILADPMGFVGNLVRAGKQGFEQFKNNFVTHLKDALLTWLTGALGAAGVYLPQSFEFSEILKFILSILGLTWENVRAKLVEHLGETPVKVLEEGFELVKLLVTEGPGAAWEKMLEHLDNLQNMVIEQIVSYVTEKIVQSAIVQLVASLNPVTGFINAIIKIYNTIQFFVSRLQQIAAVAAAVIDSLAAIASGVIGPAANKVEQTLKRLLGMAISFLASFLGLGNISEKISETLQKIRQPVDNALDKMILWVKNQAKRFLKGKDEEKHGEIAAKAVEDMKQGDVGEKPYEQIRAEKEALATQVEQKYQPELKEDIKISISFTPPNQDKVDKDLDFQITIAPNATYSNGTIQFNEDELTDDEKSKISGLKGGSELLGKIEGLKTTQPDLYPKALNEARTVLDALARGEKVILTGGHILKSTNTVVFENLAGEEKITEIDVLTSSEMIEVKGGKKYKKAATLKNKENDQLKNLLDIKNGVIEIYDESGSKIDIPRKLVYQFAIPEIDMRLKNWLIRRGVDEVRTGI